jgi:hypothetical protein
VVQKQRTMNSEFESETKCTIDPHIQFSLNIANHIYQHEINHNTHTHTHREIRTALTHARVCLEFNLLQI